MSLIMVASCTNQSIKLEIKQTLNKKIYLEMFDTVRKGYDLLSYNDFRKMHKYISIVYLEDGCHPCYTDFIEWQNKMDTLNKRSDYTVLFIINGFRYNDFIKKVHEIDSICDHYYSIMDNDLTFLKNNNDIPKWIVDNSILIDTNNSIRLVGKPWSTEEMKNLFYNICK